MIIYVIDRRFIFEKIFCHGSGGYKALKHECLNLASSKIVGFKISLNDLSMFFIASHFTLFNNKIKEKSEKDPGSLKIGNCKWQLTCPKKKKA